MIKNYIKLALKLMLRKKYYTALTLVGISFTIMIITVFASFVDQIIGANTPERNRSRMLLLDKVSIYRNGKSTDATPSVHFLQHLPKLESAETVSILKRNEFVSFLNGKTAGHVLQQTDENLWNIADFKFVEGKSYTTDDVKSGARVAVINEKTKEHFFNNEDAEGKSITIYGQAFKVIGVLKSAAAFSKLYGDVYVPYTTDMNLHTTEKAIEGTYSAIILSKSEDARKVRTELRSQMRKIGRNANGADSLKLYPFSSIEQFAKSSSSNDDEPEYGKTTIILLIVMVLFMLIPAISLINLNLSRIGERAEEIGVRKSFGATSGALVKQFIIENVIITLIGGLIGLGMSIYASKLLIQVINSFDPLFKMPTDTFIVSWPVFAFCLFSCLIFGLVSGAYPAWKMSRMNVIYALKGGNSL